MSHTVDSEELLSARREGALTTTGAIESESWVDEAAGRRVTFSRRPLVIVVLLLSDVLLALAVWQAAVLVQGTLGRGPLTDVAIASILPSVFAWVGLRAVMGLYPGYGMGQVEELRRQTLALLGTLAIIVVFAFAYRNADALSRLLLFTWALGLLLLAPLARHSVKWAMMRAGLWGKPVVVLGSHSVGASVLKLLRQEWALGLNPVGVFDNLQAPAGGKLEDVPYGGTLTDAVAVASKHKVDTVIFAMPYTRRKHLAKFVKLVSDRFRHIIIIPNLAGVTNSEVVARDLGGTFAVEVKHNLLNPWAQRSKRVLDVASILFGAVLALPLVLTLAALVRIESPGPIFYKAQRMGRDGKLFWCIKFRTMVLDAEAQLQRLLAEDTKMRDEYLKYHKLRSDPRVTRVGRFLRKTSLDELPQLWNVLRGEMSLVGPRPYLPRESEEIGATQSEILRVLPGMTGPWQVSGRNHASFEDRVTMDAHYVHSWSLWLDLILLARTVRVLLFSRDAY